MRDPDGPQSEKQSKAVTLTDRALASLKPRAGRTRDDIYDDVVPGLIIRVSAAGSKAWVLRYRRHVYDEQRGRFAATAEQRRWTFGDYPTLKLAAARDEAQAALTDLKKRGIDPGDGKREARTGSTFQDLADEYVKRHAKTQKKSWEQDDRALRVNVLPHWKNRPVKSITRREVHELIDGIADRAPVLSNRVLALIRKVFNYGILKSWLDGNPAALIPKRVETSRDRVLTDDEVKALWAALEAHTTLKRVTDDGPALAIAPMIARGLQFLLLTGQRPGEVFQARWEDMDTSAGWWTIPAEHSKNGQPHRVFLGKRALTVLTAAKAANPGNNAWVFAGAQGAHVAARAKKAASALRTAKTITFDFHRHDLRRTVATNLAKAGIARETIAHVLNHVDRGSRATQVYDKYSYDSEKQEALEVWGRRLDAILASKAERRLVSFKGRAARAHR
jgi:integrase